MSRRAEHNTLLSRSKVDCDSRMCLHRLAKLNTLNLFIKAKLCHLFLLQILFTRRSGALVSSYQTTCQLPLLNLWDEDDLDKRGPPQTELWLPAQHREHASLYGNTSHSNTSCLAVRSWLPKSLHVCQGWGAAHTKEEEDEEKKQPSETSHRLERGSGRQPKLSSATAGQLEVVPIAEAEKTNKCQFDHVDIVPESFGRSLCFKN